MLQMARDISRYARSMRKLQRQSTRRELLAGRDKLLPYAPTAWEVLSGVLSRPYVHLSSTKPIHVE